MTGQPDLTRPEQPVHEPPPRNTRATVHDMRSQPTSATGEKRSGFGLVAVTLIPAACCGLPVLLAVTTAAGTAVLVGGALGTVLLAAAALLAVTARRRPHIRARRRGPLTP